MSEKLTAQLEKDLDEITGSSALPIEKLKLTLTKTGQVLDKLKAFLKEDLFVNQNDEIFFFKKIKPQIVKWNIYHTELYTIEVNLPLINPDAQLKYFEDELTYTSRFCRQYQFMYEYYRMENTSLDHLYFIRNADSGESVLSDLVDRDTEFSTAYDHLFAKFIAFERLKDWLIEKIQYLKANPSQVFSDLNATSGNLLWTGDTINLAELGYALYNTGQLNNGTAGIGQIFRWLEEKLQINIGVPAKRLAELRSRKRLSRTRYIDEMRESLIRKIEQDESYDPLR